VNLVLRLGNWFCGWAAGFAAGLLKSPQIDPIPSDGALCGEMLRRERFRALIVQIVARTWQSASLSSRANLGT
jgi:hypothetical protein